MIEYVYKNRNNPNIVQFALDGAAIDFTAVTRMVLSFDESDTIIADTDLDASLMTWDASGNVTFNLWTLDLPDGFSSAATLIAYDPAHLDGQVIVHDSQHDLAFTFYDG